MRKIPTASEAEIATEFQHFLQSGEAVSFALMECSLSQRNGVAGRQPGSDKSLYFYQEDVPYLLISST